MTGHRFPGTLPPCSPPKIPAIARLCHITRWGTGAMGIDVCNVTGAMPASFKAWPYRHSRNLHPFSGGAVIATGIITHAKADETLQDTSRVLAWARLSITNACTITPAQNHHGLCQMDDWLWWVHRLRVDNVCIAENHRHPAGFEAFHAARYNHIDIAIRNQPCRCHRMGRCGTSGRSGKDFNPLIPWRSPLAQLPYSQWLRAQKQRDFYADRRWSFTAVSSMVVIPPIPEPIITPDTVRVNLLYRRGL